MNCTDADIIVQLLKMGRATELQAVKCLEKCWKQTSSLLLHMSLADAKERRSIFNESMAEFIEKVRRKKFVLTGEAKICTYVTEIARRKWLTVQRRTQNVTPEPVEEISAAEQERDERLHQAMLKLSDTDRDILIAFYYYDQSLDEYAVLHGISYEAAKKRISRARERLREILKPNAK